MSKGFLNQMVKMFKFDDKIIFLGLAIVLLQSAFTIFRQEVAIW